jgi:hypothetical protein
LAFRSAPCSSRLSKHDSPTAQTFFDAAILRDEVPDSLVDSTAWDLLRILRQNADLLIRDYSIGRAYEDWDGRVWGTHTGHEREPQLGWIQVTKFPPHVVDYLSSMGLADMGEPNQVIHGLAFIRCSPVPT